MMAIEHVNKPGPHIKDTVGAARDVLIWGYGTAKGHVAAVQMLTDGSADVVIEWEQPQPVVVPDVWCERTASCRMDKLCPRAWTCAAERDHA